MASWLLQILCCFWQCSHFLLSHFPSLDIMWRGVLILGTEYIDIFIIWSFIGIYGKVYQKNGIFFLNIKKSTIKVVFSKKTLISFTHTVLNEECHVTDWKLWSQWGSFLFFEQQLSESSFFTDTSCLTPFYHIEMSSYVMNSEAEAHDDGKM